MIDLERYCRDLFRRVIPSFAWRD